MTKEYQLVLSSKEEWIQPVDYSLSLLTGVTVSSVACTHTPPSGNAATITATVTDNIGYIKIPSGLALGTHFIDCVATTSNPDHSPVVRLIVRVDY